MNSSSTRFVTSGGMGMWGESFKSNGSPHPLSSTLIPNASSSLIITADMKLDNQSEDTSGTPGPLNKYEQEVTKSSEKVQRRLAQNHEAARKSRLRKKDWYVGSHKL
ncbi:unnamed protein product [Linum trigynum]|uniref:BZIP domain-containing protein n=1 Tax=Linum trigynum TaxID=586398 RepID=A0AAV2GP49_9ROSI